MNRVTLAQFANALGTSLPADVGFVDPKTASGLSMQESLDPSMLGSAPAPAPPPAPAPVPVESLPKAGAPISFASPAKASGLSQQQLTPELLAGVQGPGPAQSPEAFASQVGDALGQRGAGPGTNAPFQLPEQEIRALPPGAGGADNYGASLTMQPRFMPAGWDPSRMPYRQGSLSDQADAMARTTMGQQATMDVQAEGQRLAAEQLKQHADYIRDQNRIDMLAEQERQKRYTTVRDRASKLADEASDLKVQPGRIFADAGAGSAIALAIGGALGGFLQARQGGPNQFLQTVDRLIDKDILAQQTDIEQKWRKADAAKNSLSDLRMQLGDERLADEVQRARADKWMSTKIGAIAAQSNSDIIKQRASELQDALAMRLADRQLELDKLSWRPAMMLGGGGQGSAKQSSLFVPALGGNARTEAEAVKLREKSGAILQIQSNLRKAAALREAIGKSGIAVDKVWSDPRVAELESIIEETKPMYSVGFGQGAAGEAESSRYAKAMGGLLDFRGSPHLTARAAADRLGQNVDMLGKTSGIVKAEEGFRYDASGQLQNVNALTGDRAPTPILVRKAQRAPVGGK